MVLYYGSASVVYQPAPPFGIDSAYVQINSDTPNFDAAFYSDGYFLQAPGGDIYAPPPSTVDGDVIYWPYNIMGQDIFVAVTQNGRMFATSVYNPGTTDYDGSSVGIPAGAFYEGPWYRGHQTEAFTGDVVRGCFDPINNCLHIISFNYFAPADHYRVDLVYDGDSDSYFLVPTYIGQVSNGGELTPALYHASVCSDGSRMWICAGTVDQGSYSQTEIFIFDFSSLSWLSSYSTNFPPSDSRTYEIQFAPPGYTQTYPYDGTLLVFGDVSGYWGYWHSVPQDECWDILYQWIWYDIGPIGGSYSTGAGPRGNYRLVLSTSGVYLVGGEMLFGQNDTGRLMKLSNSTNFFDPAYLTYGDFRLNIGLLACGDFNLFYVPQNRDGSYGVRLSD